jgi:hypothetical protein
MTVTIYELDEYGAERFIELERKGGSLFVTTATQVMEFSAAEFGIKADAEYRSTDSGMIDLRSLTS